MFPIEAVLEEIRAALRDPGAAVVHAPPGAGKTTVVPPALLDEDWLGAQKVVLLEPRRLAARAAARRMASQRGEAAGRTIGYRTRLDTRVSAATRLEVVTEGVLTRMLQSDPTLDGTGLVIFDEFHERSLQADTGLALTLHTRRLVRPDLRVLVMSATLDGTAVARLIGNAPVVTAYGQAHPVETRHRAPPRRIGRRIAVDTQHVATVVRSALHTDGGDVLVFLPGAPEIHRVYEALAAEPPHGVELFPLHGSLGPDEQDRAIAPSPPGGRKVVLATSIAETSLTIEGVRVVIDSGFTRRSRFSARTGMARLETMRVSRAAADQRRGRAGRTAPGVCYRLWDEAEDATLLAFAPPEIREGDLVPLALDLAAAGIADPLELPWMDPPPPGTWSQAGELLRDLDATGDDGRITDHGRAMTAFGAHPRLAHMMLRASAMGWGDTACIVAALLGERDPLRGPAGVTGSDVRLRIDAVRRPQAHPGADRGALARIGDQARQWRDRLPGGQTAAAGDDTVGRVVALAFPDRVAQRRPGTAPRYLLRNGTGAVLPDGDPLSLDPFLVVADSDGHATEARIWLAAPVALDDIERDLGDQVVQADSVEWDDATGIRATRERRLGAIVLASQAVRDPDPAQVAASVAAAIKRLGIDVLPWSDASRRLRDRLAFLHAHSPGWPAMSDAALLEPLMLRLGPTLGRVRSGADLRRLDLVAPLLDLLDWEQRASLDRLAPTHFEAPTGSRLPIDYSDVAAPAVSVRLQEMFGVRETPAVLGGRAPLTLHLLSPAQRPVQVTRDLAGFWRSSYFDVRKNLRGRYPKHAWPEDPLSAPPTSRATRRHRE